MSSTEQVTFDERYFEFLESVSGMSHIGGQAERLYKAGEYEKLETYMRSVENQLSVEHFHNYDLLPKSQEMPDVY